MPKFFHRTLFAAVALMLLLPIVSRAQEQDKSQDQGRNGQSQTDHQGRGRFAGAQRERQHMAMLAEKLNLTDAQKQQFQQIGKDMRKQGMAIRQDSSLNADQKKEKMLALRKQSHQQMFGVLTPEQKDKIKAMREQHKKEQGKEKPSADQASAKAKAGSAESEDDDPFAGMTSDDDGPGNNAGV